ncbi:MAG: NHL repeat-containing protein [Armatimonadota bacterium]
MTHLTAHVRKSFWALLAAACAMLLICGCGREAGVDTATMTEEALQKQDDAIDSLRHVDPELIGYTETATLQTGFEEPAGIAVAPDGTVYCVGDMALHRLSTDEGPVQITSLAASPTCVSTGPDGLIYVGYRDHIEVFNPQGAQKARWSGLGERAYVTCIAADTENVYVADAGNRAIYQYTLSGEKQAEIKKGQPAGFIGFVIPSPHLDVVIHKDTLVATNPGRHQVVTFKDGEVIAAWGEFKQTIRGFCGCCNPVDIALLSDGRVVTAEKGLPRVKVYSPDGEFETVVAPPDALSSKAVGLDLAVDGETILGLDRPANCVRVFEPKSGAEAGNE